MLLYNNWKQQDEIILLSKVTRTPSLVVVLVRMMVLLFTTFRIQMASGIEFGFGNAFKAQVDSKTLAVLDSRFVYDSKLVKYIFCFVSNHFLIVV